MQGLKKYSSTLKCNTRMNMKVMYMIYSKYTMEHYKPLEAVAPAQHLRKW